MAGMANPAEEATEKGNGATVPPAAPAPAAVDDIAVIPTPIKELDDADEIERRIQKCLVELSSVHDEIPCYPLLIPGSLDADVVDDVYGELQEKHVRDADDLIVIVDSGGGDIHAAFNLAQLLRRYAKKRLYFIVPRWAKSAATLLVCAGDKLLMTPVAELGPIDPQITEFNPLENRLESFSPLHIESTLQLIRDEFANGNPNLAEGLMSRLQFPLTLGSFKTSLEVGKEYLAHLLITRMLSDVDRERVDEIAKKFVEGYSDHGFFIGCSELQEMGLAVEELDGDALRLVWDLHLLNRRQRDLEAQEKREEMERRIRELPPGLIDQSMGTGGLNGGAR